MKNFIALLFIVVSTGLLYLYVNPTYEEIKVLRGEKDSYDEALDNSQKVQDARDELLGKYNSFAPNDLKRLEKLLPNHIDNIRLIIDIDSIASRYNMVLKNVQISVPDAFGSSADVNTALPSDTLPYGIAKVSFGVSGTYETYRAFVKDIEKSLRILDITGISFSTDKGEKNAGSNTFNFETSVQTYWLIQK